jgi:hypothetical protein
VDRTPAPASPAARLPDISELRADGRSRDAEDVDAVLTVGYKIGSVANRETAIVAITVGSVSPPNAYLTIAQ